MNGKKQFEWIAVDLTLHDLINEEIAWVQIMAHRRKMLNPQPKQNVRRHLHYNEITACVLYGRIPNIP